MKIAGPKARRAEVSMSGAKRMIESQETQWDVATEIAVDAGVLERCSLHGDIL
jgi:hypothetical protein